LRNYKGPIEHKLDKIRNDPGQTLLDIGCDWGALVIQAAKRFGSRCVGIALSESSARKSGK
jgi:cyclopropane-fatty-acyl-phospholipid synthase